MQNDSAAAETEKNQTFVAGLDFYFEEGLLVMTRRFLLNRGFCCGNMCRHCPYETETAELE